MVVLMIAELAATGALFLVAYAFLTQDERPEAWWSFLPFKARYVVGYDYMREKLLEWR